MNAEYFGFLNGCFRVAFPQALAHVFPDDSEPLLPDFADLNYPNFLPTLVVDFDGVLAKIEHDVSCATV